MATGGRVLKLPPYPITAKPGDYIWLDWWRQLQDYIQEITKVAASGTVDFTSTILSYTTIPAYYVLVANYVMFTIDMDITVPITFDGTLTTAIGISGGVAGPIKRSTCSVSSVDSGVVTSRGVGFIDTDGFIYIPAFSLTAGRIIITGQYYVSE